jgi:hypothetical protein
MVFSYFVGSGLPCNRARSFFLLIMVPGEMNKLDSRQRHAGMTLAGMATFLGWVALIGGRGLSQALWRQRLFYRGG